MVGVVDAWIFIDQSDLIIVFRKTYLVHSSVIVPHRTTSHSVRKPRAPSKLYAPLHSVCSPSTVQQSLEWCECIPLPTAYAGAVFSQMRVADSNEPVVISPHGGGVFIVQTTEPLPKGASDAPLQHPHARKFITSSSYRRVTFKPEIRER